MIPSSLKGERIRQARSVRHPDPVFARVAAALAQLPELEHIKIFPDRVAASHRLSADGKKNPVVKLGAEGLVGLEVLIDPALRVVQFYAITSAFPGCGRRMVEAVLAATPEDWGVAVVMDWSGGFWQQMAQEHPRLVVF